VRLLLSDGGEQAFAVHGGFVEMSHDHVTVLSDLAEAKEQIDVERARAALARAEEAVARDPEDETAQADLRRAETRIRVATEL
jgi:F-type H+-transporting ATPase subunit epsilon